MRISIITTLTGTLLSLTLHSELQAQWVPTRGPQGGYVSSLMKNGGTTLAGTLGGGIFRSTNKGATWAQSNAGLSNLNVCALTAESGYLYAGTRNGGVFRSRDDGRTWVPVDNGIADSAISGLGSFKRSVFVSTWRRGIWRSNDHGEHWTKVGEVGGCVGFFTMGTKMFAAHVDGIRNSGDGGVSWTRTMNNTYNVSSITSLKGLLFAGTGTGVYRSTDEGITWSKVIQGLQDTSVWSLAVMRGRIYAGTASGIYVSENSGGIWTPAGDGLPGRNVNALQAVDSCLVAGTSGGIYRSADSGRSWRAANAGIVASSVVAFGGDERHLYAGTFRGGLFTSTNRGARWIEADSGMPQSVIRAVAKRDSEVLAALDGGGFYRSSDGGRLWSPANHGLEKAGADYPGGEIRCHSLAVKGEMLFVSTGGGLFSSSNFGTSWSPAGLARTPASGYPILALAVVGRMILAGGIPGIYQSPNNGADWNRVDSGSAGFVETFAVDYAHLYAGGGGFWRSSDSGSTWVSSNIGTTGRVSAVTARGPFVLAGSELGVRCSSDHGGTWMSADEGLPKGGVFALTFAGEDILAGTRASGVWRRPLSDLRLSLAVHTVGVAAAFSLKVINPNPFNSTLLASYQIPVGSNVSLTLLDITGRPRSIVVNKYQREGSHEKSFDMKELGPGIYFYQLRVGMYIQTKKVLWLGLTPARLRRATSGMQ